METLAEWELPPTWHSFDCCYEMATLDNKDDETDTAYCDELEPNLHVYCICEYKNEKSHQINCSFQT